MNASWRYIIRRLIYMIPVLLGVCLIIFFLFNVLAGDPTLLLLGKHASVDQMNELREQLGLNQSMFAQYLDVVKSAFTFDFGRSWATKQEISTMIMNGVWPTLTLTVPAFIISTFTSILFAVIVAYYRGKGIDLFIRISCIAMMSVSSLAYILLFQHFLAFKFGLFEISGYEAGFPNFLYYVSLPIIIWIILRPDIRFYRTMILDEIYQDYVRTARAKGLSEKVVLFKHVLRNALIPIITYTVIQIPFLILGSLLLESFFSIPGLGGMIITAINSNDFPVLKAMTILTAIGYVIFTLVQDIIYTMVDPRVKLQ